MTGSALFYLAVIILLGDLANAIFGGHMSQDGSIGFGLLAMLMLAGSAAMRAGEKAGAL